MGERAAGPNQPLQVGAFLWQFWESTLENWQSEFLQPFSFVALSALFIHRASAESKDSDEQTQQSIAMHWCSRWLAT